MSSKYSQLECFTDILLTAIMGLLAGVRQSLKQKVILGGVDRLYGVIPIWT